MTIFDPRHAAAVILAASIGILGAAFFFQFVVGLDPCVLCILERYPYAAAIGLSALALFPFARPWRGWLVGLCGLAFLVGGGIAVFHVGVEQHWWAGTSACTGALGANESLADVLAQAQKGPVTRCDEVPWSLFGISMAGYNVLASLALVGFCAVMARRLIGARQIS